MEHCVNKRTLKKRIRNVISLCIFLTVLIFSAAIIFITAQMFKTEALFITDHFSFSISQEMNSDYFLKQMSIHGLEEFDTNAQISKEWLKTLKDTEDTTHLNKTFEEKMHPGLKKQDLPEYYGIYDQTQPGLPFLNEKAMVYTQIVLNGNTVYSTKEDSNVPDNSDLLNLLYSKPLVQKILKFFSSTGSTYPLFDSKGILIGNVTSTLNQDFLLVISVFLGLSIIFAAFLSLFVGNFLGKLITIPITSPLKRLDEKIRAVSLEEYDTGFEKQIVLKRPLKEIESLADATNQIMHKMSEYNNILGVQKAALENQNHELEAQNEELTESKKQIQEAQALLVQSENMASIGQLTAAITHEINTPLGAINSNVQISDMLVNSLLKIQSVKESSEIMELFKQLKESNSISIMACNRVTEIIRSLKTFSKLDQAEFQEASVNEGIKSVLVLTSNLWKRKIRIHEEYGDIPMAKCFPGLLNQVFMNVIVNAIQAIEEKGDIYIKTSCEEDTIKISISDTGSGIKEEYLSRIFDSGFSTKGSGIGAGLGLSICQNIIKKHDGLISVKSEIGQGTEFTISIPVNN